MKHLYRTIVLFFISITTININGFIPVRIVRQACNTTATSILKQLVPEIGKFIIDLTANLPNEFAIDKNLTIKPKSSIKSTPDKQHIKHLDSNDFFAPRVELLLNSSSAKDEIEKMSFHEQEFLICNLLGRFFDPSDPTPYIQMYPLIIACNKMNSDIIKMLEKHTAKPYAIPLMKDLKSLPPGQLPKKIQEQMELIKQKVKQQGYFTTLTLVSSKL